MAREVGGWGEERLSGACAPRRKHFLKYDRPASNNIWVTFFFLYFLSFFMLMYFVSLLEGYHYVKYTFVVLFFRRVINVSNGSRIYRPREREREIPPVMLIEIIPGKAFRRIQFLEISHFH